MMMLKRMSQVISFIPGFIKTFHFLVRHLNDFIGKGGISIETPFQYKSTFGNGNRNFLFRTTIQPDGDIINFLAQPDLFVNDVNFNKQYEEKYGLHLAKVQKLLSELEGIWTIPWLISILSSLFFVLSIKKGFSMFETKMMSYVWFVLWITLIIPFQRFVSNHLFRKIIDFVIKKRLIKG